MAKGISMKKISGFEKEYESDRANILAARSAFKNGIIAASADYEAVNRLSNSFSLDLKQGSITNQRSSGRCWIFSALNILRFEMIHKYNMDDFEFSQNYIYFYDKLEKSNYYLESILEIADERPDSRLYSFINGAPLQDGGQWDMFANLVRKYGLMPKEAYPDANGAVNSKFFRQYITSLLREDAVALVKMKKAGKSAALIQKEKERMLGEVYRCLCISLGKPPKKFDYILKDKEGGKKMIYGITPQEFAKTYLPVDIDDYVSLINAPTEDKPFNKMFTVNFLGNVAEGSKVRYLNLEIDKIKEFAIKQIKDGHPVWFGSDCSKFALRDDGIFDRSSANVEELYGIRYKFTKGERLTYGESAMNHAMVFLGVNIDENGKPNRWRVENSWGPDAGLKGYYIASDPWFDEFVYQVVVNKKYMDAKTRKLLEGKEIELEPWDPMGTLAD